MGKLFRFQLASCERCKRGERDSFSMERQFLKLVNIFSLSECNQGSDVVEARHG